MKFDADSNLVGDYLHALSLSLTYNFQRTEL